MRVYKTTHIYIYRIENFNYRLFPSVNKSVCYKNRGNLSQHSYWFTGKSGKIQLTHSTQQRSLGFSLNNTIVALKYFLKSDSSFLTRV